MTKVKAPTSKGRLSLMERPALKFSTVFLVLTNLLVFQFGVLQGRQSEANVVPETSESSISRALVMDGKDQIVPVLTSQLLSTQIGEAIALPSVRLVPSDSITSRDLYGGQGDKDHLGGFTEVDIHGLTPSAWLWMVTEVGVKSVLDVGCGRGISTTWFVLHGVDAMCVEGSHDAYEKSMLPDKETRMVEHDFSRGPWWPSKTVDAVWCVEFLEHVGRNFHKNYLPAFRKSALIFASHSTWGGWHHVEVHTEDWWILKFEMYGFKYSEKLTLKLRDTAKADKGIASKIKGAKDGKFNSQHVWLHMMVFINPAVAALPQHAHLLAEEGCFKTHATVGGQRMMVHRPCGTGKNSAHETVLPEEFKPIRIDEPDKKRVEWEDW
eukprot:CAMPEP_0119006214 /NCGR_PEP_ID=MMETSP1176-20130426/2171_1 /TAXON_ID=265551 /ORGANISM="Synedropsis recta cf, Strain CCMP1620" /LENGTH=379 /DNA_ID=CAMNT_0006958107 /DNA_START=63 /DNA_END=1199 /DNA_ORIENTATION=+